MFKYILILLSSLLLFGCSTQSNIRPELLNDAKSMYALMDNDFKNATHLDDSNQQKVNIFLSKYQNLSAYNEDEKKLISDVADLIMAVENNDMGRMLNNENMKDNSIQDYLKCSEKVKNDLNLN